MASALENALTTMDASLTRIRRELAHADLQGFGSTAEERDRSATTRAFTYVWIAAALERFVRETLQHALVELNTSAPAHHTLRPSLFALLGDGMLTSIATQRRNASWSRRVEMFDLLESRAPASFTPEILPVDGRTLRREHFDNIWRVFGLQGSSLPSPAHAPALNELAQGRNIVAHGNEDPVIFGRSKVTTDILRLASRIDDIGSHLAVAIEGYLNGRGFAR